MAAHSRWNQRPAYASKPLLGVVVSRSAALQSAAVYAAVAAVAAGVSNYGMPLLRWMGMPHLTTIGMLLSGAVLLGVYGVVRTVSSWRDSVARAHAQAGLGPTQRKLLGLPPMPPARPAVTPEAAPAAARAAALLATPATPAQRLAFNPSGMMMMSDTGGRSQQLLMGATPGSAGGRSSSWAVSSPGGGPRLSPWSAGPAVATPDQLRGYLAPYHTPAAPGGSAGAGGAGDALGGGATAAAAGSPGGYYAGGGMAGAGGGMAGAAAGSAGIGGGGSGGGGGADGGVDQGPAGSPALPIGRDAPAYRPSMLPRKAAAGAAAGASEGLQPSADAEAGRIMREALKMEVVQLVLWIERFREWMASQVLGPLARLMATAHEEPNEMLRRLSTSSEQAPQLPPITSLLGVDIGEGRDALLLGGSTVTTAAAAGGSTGGGGGGGSLLGSLALNPGASLLSQALNVLGLRGRVGGSGPNGGGGAGGGGDAALAVEEACGFARSLMQQLQAGQLPYGFDPQPIILALHRYSELLLLLSGRRPGELLPPAPPSYIAARVWQLAQGTCVKDFSWAGGGEHGGQPWTQDLPSDSGLLFYLFAAFLDAPGWNFPPPGAAGPESSRGAPLYLGSMRPQRNAAAFSALLAFRPDKPGPEAAAVIGSNLASRAPRFSLIFGGQQITLCERDGLFKVLLMWLKYHVEKRQGLVGGRFLNEAALGGLQDVLDAPASGPSIPQRVFTWWYPPNK